MSNASLSDWAVILSALDDLLSLSYLTAYPDFCILPLSYALFDASR